MTPLDEAMRISQFNQYNQYNGGHPAQKSSLDVVREKLSALTSDELGMLRGTNEFNHSFGSYQLGLQEYVMNKFASEYASTEKGRSELDDVSRTIDMSLESVRKKSKQEKERLEKLAKLLEENPDILNQLKPKDGKDEK